MTLAEKLQSLGNQRAVAAERQRNAQVKVAEEVRDAAIANAGAHAPAAWTALAHLAVRDIAARQDYFTADDLWAVLRHPPEPRALGAILREAQVAGICEPTERVQKSARVVNHARRVTIWKSRLR